MEPLRKPLQGVTNIIRFNRHFYLLSGIVVLLTLIVNYSTHNQYQSYINILCLLIVSPILISLVASLYIYDLSNLYQLKWLDKIKIDPGSRLININAGFDETSEVLSVKYPAVLLQVFDFYDPQKHTEISIKYARKAYPPYKNTIPISTSHLPAHNNTADNILITFAAHEIRNKDERIFFFTEMNRVLKEQGKIVITEHIRNFQNFATYNIGFFHFLSRSVWLETFHKSNLAIEAEIKINPFITMFIVTKNGIAL